MVKNSIGSIAILDTSDIGVTHSGRYYLMGITWVSDDDSGYDIVADDDFLLNDANGIRIAGKRAEAAGDDFGVSFAKPLPVEGLKLTTLDGGLCVLYLHVL